MKSYLLPFCALLLASCAGRIPPGALTAQESQGLQAKALPTPTHSVHMPQVYGSAPWITKNGIVPQGFCYQESTRTLYWSYNGKNLWKAPLSQIEGLVSLECKAKADERGAIMGLAMGSFMGLTGIYFAMGYAFLPAVLFPLPILFLAQEEICTKEKSPEAIEALLSHTPCSATSVQR